MMISSYAPSPSRTWSSSPPLLAMTTMIMVAATMIACHHGVAAQCSIPSLPETASFIPFAHGGSWGTCRPSMVLSSSLCFQSVDVCAANVDVNSMLAKHVILVVREVICPLTSPPPVRAYIS
jgi:hypothetical protein